MELFKERLPFEINGHRFDMVFVKGSTFLMGDDEGEYDSEKPAHPVELDDFYIGQYPVTQALWKAVMGEENNPSYFEGDDRPVETISWKDCQEFLLKLNSAIKHATHHFRLPTEAEWEYAARGGIHQDSFQYAGSNHLKEVGWYTRTSHRETKAVRQLEANGLDLYDMSGNVLEWCEDWFDRDYYAECKRKGRVKNPVGPASGSDRVFRGGSWDYDPVYCRVTDRSRDYPEHRYHDIGFRLVWSSVSRSGASIEQKEDEGRIKK